MADRKCPNCGRGIPVTQYACPACWHRLPYRLKRPILVAYHARNWDDHDAAKKAAQDWFDANPAPT